MVSHADVRPPAPSTGGLKSSVWALLKLALGIALVVSSSATVAWGAHRYALTTPRFAIETVDLRGARRLSHVEVKELMGVKLGQNIFTVDLAQAERKLTESPYVRRAKVSRELPNELRVELSEYEAEAVAVLSGQFYLVTRDGEPFKVLEPSDPHDLPVVTGLSAENLARDRAREVERGKSALSVLHQYEAMPLSKTYRPQEVHLVPGGGIVLTIGGRQPISLHLGEGPYRRRLLMAHRVIREARRRGRLPAVVFLDNRAHPERVVVRVR